MAKLNANLLDDLTIKAARSRDAEYTLRDGNGLFFAATSKRWQILSHANHFARQA